MELNNIQQLLNDNIILFIGAPLAGKSTQGTLLAKVLERPYVSTGNLFRNEVASGNELGQKIKVYMDSGELIPNELTITFLTTKFNDPIYQNGIILDGFPRNLSHMPILENILTNLDRKILVAMYLDVSKAQLDQRRIHRSRADDDNEIAERRYAVFQQETLPLVDLFESRNILIKITCSSESPENVHQRILSQLAMFIQKK